MSDNKNAPTPLQTIIAAMKTAKTEFSGKDNMLPVIEAACETLGVTKLTNDIVNQLCANELKGLVSVPSLRGVCVATDYYAKKTEAEKASEHGTSQTRKSELVKTLEILAGAQSGDFDSLGKAKKPELELFVELLQTRSAQFNAEKGLKE